MPTDQYVPPKPRCGYRVLNDNINVVGKPGYPTERYSFTCGCPTGEHIDGVMCIDDPTRCAHVYKWEGGHAPTAALIRPSRRKPGITKRKTISKEERYSGQQRSKRNYGEGE